MISSGLLQCKINAVSKIGMAVILLLLVLAVPCSAEQRLGDKDDGITSGLNDHPHNLSTNSQAPIHSASGTDQICIFCHTPHSATAEGPLWNRTNNISPVSGGTFPLYGGLVLIKDGASGANYGTDYPNGASRLCLSCHDGVTAIGEVINSGWSGSPIASLGSLTVEGSVDGVIDLETSHPISFTYDDAVWSYIDGIKSGEYARMAPAIALLDAESRMQCTACHDPHLDTFDGGYSLPMWRNFSGNEGSDYDNTCGACHVGVVPVFPLGEHH